MMICDVLSKHVGAVKVFYSVYKEWVKVFGFFGVFWILFLCSWFWFFGLGFFSFLGFFRFFGVLLWGFLILFFWFCSCLVLVFL